MNADDVQQLYNLAGPLGPLGEVAVPAELLDQHRAINEALQSRDPAGARAAIISHLNFVETALAAQRRADRNEIVAQLRFEHEKQRQ